MYCILSHKPSSTSVRPPQPHNPNHYRNHSLTKQRPRPQRNNIHNTRRNLPHALPRNMPRHQRSRRETRLDPRPAHLQLLPLRLSSRQRSHHPPRICPHRLQRVHDPGCCGDAFLDSASAAPEWEGEAVGWEVGDFGDAGAGEAWGWESICGTGVQRKDWAGKACVVCVLGSLVVCCIFCYYIHV